VCCVCALCVLCALYVCVCVCVCAVCSRLCCRAQPFTPDRLLLLPSIELSTASFGKIPAQLAILGAMTSWSIARTHARYSSSRYSTYIARNREANVPPSCAHHKVDYILIAFVSPLSVWLQRPASIRRWASGKSLYRAVPVTEGRDPPAGWTDTQHCSFTEGRDPPAGWTNRHTTLQLH